MYTPPTVSDFKAYFLRDFPYAVPACGAVGAFTFTSGVITDITVTDGGQLYTAAPTVTILGNGTGATATATVNNGAVSAFAVTDGGTGYTEATLSITGGGGDPTDLSKVTDKDISKAFVQAKQGMNSALFAGNSTEEGQEFYETAYLWLAAHYLVIDLRAAAQGVAGQYSWLTSSKSVGNVSESYQFPERIMKSPYLSLITTTPYGAKYLSLIMPLLSGNVRLVAGWTTP